MNGKIKAVTSKGYGFIQGEKHIDFFFHRTAYDGDWKRLLSKYINLKEGESINVEFINDTTATEGPRAIGVKII